MWLTDISRHNSIKVGKLFIKPRSAEEFLSRCVRPVVSEDSDPEMLGFVGLSGSASLIKINCQKMICMTRHQLGSDLKFDDALMGVRIVTGESGRLDNIPFDRAILSVGNGDEEHEDIFVIMPDESDSSIPRDSPYYFNIRKIVPNDSSARFCFVGYPIIPKNYILDGEGKAVKLHSIVVVKDCHLDTGFSSKSKYFNRYIFEQDSKWDSIPLNGLSGGSVFGLIKIDIGYEFFHAGIITRAGNGYIYSVNSNYLLAIDGQV